MQWPLNLCVSNFFFTLASIKKKFRIGVFSPKTSDASSSGNTPEYNYVDPSAYHFPVSIETDHYLEPAVGNSKKAADVPPGSAYPGTGRVNCSSEGNELELSRNYHLMDPNYTEVQEQGSGHEDEVYAELYESPSTKQQEVWFVFNLSLIISLQVFLPWTTSLSIISPHI